MDKWFSSLVVIAMICLRLSSVAESNHACSSAKEAARRGKEQVARLKEEVAEEKRVEAQEKLRGIVDERTELAQEIEGDVKGLVEKIGCFDTLGVQAENVSRRAGYEPTHTSTKQILSGWLSYRLRAALANARYFDHRRQPLRTLDPWSRTED